MSQPVPGLIEQDPLPQPLHRDPATIPQGGTLMPQHGGPPVRADCSEPIVAKEVPRGFHPFPADPPPRPGRYLGLTDAGPLVLTYSRVNPGTINSAAVAYAFFRIDHATYPAPSIPDAVRVHAWRVVPAGWA